MRLSRGLSEAFGQWFKTVGNNVEMANYTQALYDARELAMARMQVEAMSLRAEGVVGAQVHEKNHGWGSHVIEYFCHWHRRRADPRRPQHQAAAVDAEPERQPDRGRHGSGGCSRRDLDHRLASPS